MLFSSELQKAVRREIAAGKKLDDPVKPGPAGAPRGMFPNLATTIVLPHTQGKPHGEIMGGK